MRYVYGWWWFSVVSDSIGGDGTVEIHVYGAPARYGVGRAARGR